MVCVYAIDIKNLPDPKTSPDVLNFLHGGRRIKTMGYARENDRKRSLGAAILLEKILPCHGASADKITYGTNGKPETDGIYFNISHCKSFVICATGQKSVGCDIEKIGNEKKGMAERFFHENETAFLNSFDDKTRSEMFFRLWTMKESYIKMTGEGLSVPLNSFEILIETNPDAEKISVKRDGKILACHITEYDIPEYKISVCAQEGNFEKKIKYITP